MEDVIVLWYSPSPSWNRDVVGQGICLCTGSPFSHVAVCVRGTLFEALPGGVRRLDGDAATARAAGASASKTFQIRTDLVDNGYAYLVGRVGDGYSYLGCFNILVSIIARFFGLKRPVVRMEGEEFCSYLVGDFLLMVGCRTKDDETPELESPGTLARDFSVKVGDR